MKDWNIHMRVGIASLIIVGLLAVMGALAPSAGAADIRSGERVVIGADQVINDDLFIAGEQVIIDGTVKGDVYAFANTLTINGTVDHDVIAGAQTIILNGKVGDTVRVGGQAIVLGENAKIVRSALVGGMALETKPGSVIGHDLWFGAYGALLGGNVANDVVAGAKGIQLNGTVGRNLRVSVGDENNAGPSPLLYMPTATIAMPNVPAGLTLAPSAKVGGDLIYESASPANIGEGAQISGPVSQVQPSPDSSRRQPTAQEIARQQQEQMTNFWLDQLRRFVTLLAIGFLALWLLPKWIGQLSDFVRAKPLGSFGRGVLMFFAFVATLLVITFVMILLAVLFGVITFDSLAWLTVGAGVVVMLGLTFAYVVFTSYIAPIVISYLGGRLILDRVQATWARNRFVAFVLGLIILSLLALIPVVNVIVGILVALFALGALLLWAASKFTRPGVAAVQTI